MTRKDILLVIGLLALFGFAAAAGLPERLGAHPWWALRAGIVGSLIGAAAALALAFARVDGAWPRWLAVLGLTGALLAAILGKRAFVASMAENALAGRFWFLGWFAVVACLFLVAFLWIRGRINR